MKISELKPKQGKVDIEVEITEVGESKEFAKFGKSGKVANAKAKDSSGKITLSLWNEQVDMVQPGTRIKITNGYVNEWQGEMQLTTGRFGKLEVIEGGVDIAAKKEKKAKDIEKDYESDDWEEPSEDDIEADAKSKKIIEEDVDDE